MPSALDQIKELLAGGDLSGAVQTALDWFSGSQPLVVGGALGAALRPLIDSGHSQAVNAFLIQLKSFLDPAVIQVIRSGMEIERSEQGVWAERLPAVTQERLGRECRDAIRLKRYDLALERVRQILALQVADQPLEGRCHFLGMVLGSLENMPGEVETVWQRAEAKWHEWNMPANLKQVVIKSRQDRLNSIYDRRYEMSEQEWTRLLTELAMTLRGELPRPNQLSNPTEEEIQRFLGAARGLVDFALRSPRQIMLPDALWILDEYTPREQTATATRAGIEQRIHATLGPTARGVVSEGMRRLAQVEPLRRTVLSALEDPPLDRYRDMALDLMAALAWPGFAEAALGVLRDKRLVAHHIQAINAVGNCGGAKALALLFDVIQTACKGRVVDGNERRLVIAILRAMGQVVRRDDVTDHRRDALLDRLIKIVPRDDTRLHIGIASNICLHRPEALSPNLLEWSVRQLLNGLWRPESRANFDRPDHEELRRRPLGQRQGYVTALTRLGETALPIIHSYLLGDDARVTGAYVAMAEILSKVGSPTSVPALEGMLRNALMVTDDDLKGAYSEEEVFDPEAGRLVPLSRDALVGSVLGAMRQIGSPEAFDILHRFRQQIELGQVPNFGKMTTDAISNLPTPVQGSEPDGRSEAIDERGPSTEDLIADLTRGGFLGLGASKIRERKVTALAHLAKRFEVEAIEPMIATLGDRDPLVRASAKTALLACAAPSAPVKVQEIFASLAIDELGNGKSPSRDALLEMLSQVNTTVEPWASRLNHALELNPTGAMRAAIARLRRGAGGAFEVAEETAKASAPPKIGGGLDKIGLKRQYLDARRAWIAGGKQGPPPEPPEGLE